MFVARKNLMPSVLYLCSLLVCCQLYPMRGSTEELYGNYGMSLAKRDPPMSLKDSLISALLMTELPKAGTPSQRKKAVDSTFIRFGRSSMSGVTSRTPNTAGYDDFPHTSLDGDFMGSTRNNYPGSSPMDNIMDKKLAKESAATKLAESFPHGYAAIQNGCLIKSKSDLYMVLMGKTCLRSSPKVKRENVNDTFIRFGKRNVPDSFPKAEGSENDIKYGR